VLPDKLTESLSRRSFIFIIFHEDGRHDKWFSAVLDMRQNICGPNDIEKMEKVVTTICHGLGAKGNVNFDAEFSEKFRGTFQLDGLTAGGRIMRWTVDH
jgi:hypothetical protein